MTNGPGAEAAGRRLRPVPHSVHRQAVGLPLLQERGSQDHHPAGAIEGGPQHRSSTQDVVLGIAGGHRIQGFAKGYSHEIPPVDVLDRGDDWQSDVPVDEKQTFPAGNRSKLIAENHAVAAVMIAHPGGKTGRCGL